MIFEEDDGSSSHNMVEFRNPYAASIDEDEASDARTVEILNEDDD